MPVQRVLNFRVVKSICENRNDKKGTSKKCTKPQVSVASLPAKSNRRKQPGVKRKGENLEEIAVSPTKKAVVKTTSYARSKQALIASDDCVVVGRTEQLSFLRKFFDDCFKDNKSGSLYISGAPGTGKTACLSSVIQEKGKNTKTVFVNCMGLKTSSEIYSRIALNLEIKVGKKDSSLESIKKFVQDKKTRAAIIVLDEIDALESKNQTVLYSLYELPTLPNSNVIVVGIANSFDLTDRCVPLLQAYGYRPALLHFPPYTRNEIVDIIKTRLGSDADIVQPAAVMFLASKITACSGDVRKALDVCRRAIELAEGAANAAPLQPVTPNSPRKSPRKQPSAARGGQPTVGIFHISAVLNDTTNRYTGAKRDFRQGMPLQQKLVLCTLLLYVRKLKVSQIPLGHLETAYRRVCKSQRVTEVDQSDFQTLCSLLESRGLLAIKNHKEVRQSKITFKIDENEMEHLLEDDALLSSCLDDTTIVLDRPPKS